MTKLKQVFEKAVLWIKHHWWIPLGIIGILVLSFVSKDKVKSLIDLRIKNKKDYESSIKKLDKIHEKQILGNLIIEEEKETKIINIEKQRKKSLDNLDKQKQKKVKDLSKKSSKELADKMKKDFNL